MFIMQSERINRCTTLRMCEVIFSTLILQGGLVCTSLAQVPTQITSDGTMGTVVTQTGTLHDITGGTRPGDGSNLFHSFGQFSVGAGDTANFLNETSLPTQNILSRVTGGDPSNIFGTIQTTDFGSANLFLLNPAGVVFGPTASLNVGGSFHLSTADYLRMGEDGVFYAGLSETSVLTMAPPEAFGFLSGNPNSISIDKSALEVSSGEALSFVGGDIEMTGGQLTSPNGQITLASLSSEGTVGFSQGSDVQVNAMQHGEIGLSDGASINADGSSGGTVVIRGGHLMVDGSSISANTTGPAGGPLEDPGAGIDIEITGDLLVDNGTLIEANVLDGAADGGDVILKSTGNLTVNGSSFVQTHPLGGSGDAGNIVMEADQVRVSGFSLVWSQSAPPALGNSGDILVTGNGLQIEFGGVFTPTMGAGHAGNIEVNVPGGDVVVNGGAITANSPGSGNAGHVGIEADNLEVTFFSSIQSNSFGSGNAGGVTLNLTGRLDVQDRSTIEVTSQTTGADGDLNISAKDIVITGIRDAMFPETADLTGLTTQTTGGPGADINIMAENLTVTDTGFISSATRGAGKSGNVALLLSGDLVLSNGGEIAAVTRGTGDAGSIIVEADLVDLDGGNAVPIVRADGTDSLAFALITTQSEGRGHAGNLAVTARQVNILDGAAIDSRSKGEGNGGTIRVSADSILISGDNPEKTAFLTQNGLNPERGLASITTENEGLVPGPDATGVAGDIFIEARNNLELNHGLISARSGSAGVGGSIQAITGELSLFNNASITAKSTSEGNAGNIDLLANSTIMLDNSTVTAEATEASGGNIKLTAEDLIQLNDSTIASSVQGDVNTVGGDISLDPDFIILQNSHILAKAVQGQGGNITLIANDTVLVDSFSTLDASSQLGVSGTVNVQAPTKFLSEAIVPLEDQPVNVATLYGARCVAGAGGHFSTFVDSKKDSLSPTPGRFLASPLLRPSAQAVADSSARPQTPVILTASIAPLVLGHAGEPTTACP